MENSVFEYGEIPVDKTLLQSKNLFLEDVTKLEGLFYLEYETIDDNQEFLDFVDEQISKQQFLMSRVATDIDLITLQGAREGRCTDDFLASKAKHLNRQIKYAKSESKRLTIRIEELKREIAKIEKIQEEKGVFLELDDKIVGSLDLSSSTLSSKFKWSDLEIRKRKMELEECRQSLFNRMWMLKRFIQVYSVLIKKNGGKPFSEEQFQKEQPKFYEWFLSDAILRDMVASRTGIGHGVFKFHQELTKTPFIPQIIGEVNKIVHLSCEEGKYDQTNILLNYEKIFGVGANANQLFISAPKETSKYIENLNAYQSASHVGNRGKKPGFIKRVLSAIKG